MDSDESRPGSSASNTSSSSADSNENIENGSPTSSRKSRSKSMNSNSSSSSSSRNNSNDDGRQSALSVNDGDQKSLRSVSHEDGAIRSRSASIESNQSYSSNDSNVNDEDGIDKHQRRNSNVSSQNGRSVSRNQSISPVRRNSKSSRNSSVSSVASDEDEQLKADDISDNEIDVSQWAAKEQNGSQDGIENVASDVGNQDSNQEKDGVNNNAEQQKHLDTLNMSHEDLSDVSDLESAAVSPSNESEKHQDEEVNDVRMR